MNASKNEHLSVSVIVPVFNEAAGITRFLSNLMAVLRSVDEVILVDGESTDKTEKVIHQFIKNAPRGINQAKVHLLKSRKGRAVQMNLGARHATGEVLLFLHADTELTRKAFQVLTKDLQSQLLPGIKFWGRFDLRVRGRSIWFPLIGLFISWRSRFSRISTGDQCLFLSKSLFTRVGGFYDQPLMEDIELCKTLKTQPDVMFIPIHEPVITSGRRWEAHGVWSTILLMWIFRYKYWRGANAYDLARKYRDVRQEIESNHAAASSLAGIDQKKK